MGTGRCKNLELNLRNVSMIRNLFHFLRGYSGRITINTIQMFRDQLVLFILTFDLCPGFIV